MTLPRTKTMVLMFVISMVSILPGSRRLSTPRTRGMIKFPMATPTMRNEM